ncbi:MAG: protease I [Candidatus Berkelbacteria bacterium Licking1014_2]|uniref:Protease I n=1 Tax=Candidatus Berkelbacteria bacterium Licking1014_2 TaxID=2017146 RepID=A0A554LW76_9BACT|nr:MAG: protease I [Candidatus Berkelbacteria bacterium Licking1014_2]
MELMKKFLFIIPPRDFRDPELLEPKRILEEAGVEVIIASTTAGEVIGAEGNKAQATVAAAEAAPLDYDGVAFVGGPGTMAELENPDFLSLAKRFCQAGKLIAAICAAPAILANASLLKGKKVTAWSGVKDLLVQKGALWQDEPVVTDGSIITANGPAAAGEFGQAIAQQLRNH